MSRQNKFKEDKIISCNNIKCPRCKTKVTRFLEKITTNFVYDIEDGILLDGVLENIPERIRGVWGSCDTCTYSWKLRGIKQIIQFKEYENVKVFKQGIYEK